MSWNFHNLAPGANPEEAIDIIGGMGFESIELIVCARDDLKDYWTDAKADQLRKQLGRHRLAVSQFALFQPVVEGLTSLADDERKRSVDCFESGCRLAAKLGSPLVNIVAPWARELQRPGGGYLPRHIEVFRAREGQKFSLNISPTFDFDAIWRQWVATVRELLARAKAHGLKLTVEHHTHCLVPDADAFLRLWDAIRDPNLGYNLDTGWTLLQREYPPVAIHKAGPRLMNLHMRDIDGYMRIFVAVGAGVMDFQAVADALKRIGFRGSLDIEQDHNPGMNMRETCACYLRLMKQCLG